MSTRISVVALPAAAAVTALAIAGCGGGGSSYATGASSAAAKPMTVAMRMHSAAARGAVLKLTAAPSGQLRFTTSRLTAPRPGKVTLVMRNPSSTGMNHGVAIQGNGIHRNGPIVAPGRTATLTVSLKKGTYTYYCPVPGHRQAGMRGTLTVK
jgi:uncharacterized cupredoxin-like copper-binding protein